MVRRIPSSLIVALLVWTAPQAMAICLDADGPTLEEEVRTAVAIVVGRIADKHGLDELEPEFWPEIVYRVTVVQSLYGDLRGDIQLKSMNDMDSYLPSVGTTHLLFLQKRGEYYSVDPCGNSMSERAARGLISRLQALLSGE